jgi:membrane associated rhomboid family serine protease
MPLNTYVAKLRHILPTYFAIALCTVCGPLLLRWLVDIELDLIDLPDDTWSIRLPLALPWLPIVYWFRPRLRVLTFKWYDDKRKGLMILIAGYTIVACSVCSQEFVTAVTSGQRWFHSFDPIDALLWALGSFCIGLGLLLLILALPRYDETERNRFVAGVKPQHDPFVDFMRFFVPRGDHYASSVVIDIVILVFVCMVLMGVNLISPSGDDLLRWGAIRRTEIAHGEWWRLWTSMFLTFGLMHTALTISGLVLAAKLLEPVIGRVKYFIVYVISGLCGNIASIVWYSNTISVGASGAALGLFGAALGLYVAKALPNNGSKRTLIVIMAIAFVYANLTWGLVGDLDNAAHISGFVSGAMIGIVLSKLYPMMGRTPT